MKSYTLTRVPRADLVAIAVGLVVALLAALGIPAEVLEKLDTEKIATLLTALFGTLIALAAAIRAAWYKGVIEDDSKIGDKGVQ